MATYRLSEIDYNFLPPNAFKCTFNGIDDAEFLIQNVSIPSIVAPSVRANTRFQTVPYDSTVLNYEPIVLSFIVDEELKSYMKLYEIFKGLYGNAKEPYDFDETKRTFTISSLTSKFNQKYDFVFVNFVPTQLGELNFSTMEPDISYLTTTLTLDYELFYIREKDTFRQQ